VVCHGGFNLDEATRRSWYNPEAILNSLGEGMVFADVGCGEGFFTILAAKKVGQKGKVFAVDIDTQAIERLNQKATLLGLQNITTKVGSAEDVVFCSKCVDIVFYSMVLHDFSDATMVLKNARSMLKPSGILLDLDWKKMQVPFGPPFAIRFSEEYASTLIQNAGFKEIDVKDIGTYHYVITAKPLP
jgi:ubiquinone/menaquinone biosynthesis C-methylase UbiE